MTDKLDISDAIMILENEKPHCGEKMIFTEEHRCEAYDMAIEALEAVGNTDRLAKWLEQCRDATPEERESVHSYIESISTTTGVTFDEVQDELDVADGDRAVSLNAVIDIIKEVCPIYGHSSHNCYVQDRIKELPSVGKEINVPTTDCISRQAVFAQLVAGMEVAE